MTVSATLSTPALAVEPGSQASCEVRVRNTGQVVDQFSFEVLGDAAGWATVEPAVISLFPDAGGTALVRFSPPRASGLSGEIPFAVKVTSREDPTGTIVEEGMLQVGRFADVAAELLPRTARGSRRATYELALDNRGNTRVNAALTASDPDELLTFAMEPPSLVAEPGTAAFTKVVVSPRKRFWRGPPQTRAFQVQVAPENQAAMPVEGTFLQEAILPKWFGKAVLALIVLLLLLVVAWFVLLKPSIKSAAKEAVAEAAEPAAITPGGGGGDEAGGEDKPDEPGGDSNPEPVVAEQGKAIDGRLFLTGKGETAYTVPDGKILQLTDIVLQNPNGETGLLQIRRNGTALLVVELGNFRDLDYHFVAPVVFSAGQKLELAANCTSPTCTPGAYFAGFQVNG